MLGIRFIKSQPTTHLMQFRRGRVVREGAGFPSRSSQASLVYGEVVPGRSLKVRSRMPENGVIFSDGIEADFLSFTAGVEAKVDISANKGQLIV